MPCTKCKDGKYKWGESGSCKYNSKADCQKANPKHYNKDIDMETTTITELVISEENTELAIDCISLVSQPALEINFVYMNKQKNNLTLSKIDEPKRQIISPALIPDKSIFRFDPNTQKEYYVYFSKSTVERCSQLYLKNNNHHKATTQHEERVGGILTVESWIVEDTKKDKSTLYGFKMPVGTWMVKLQVDNEEVWQRVLSGEIKGLSIEGFFVDRLEQMSKPVEPTDKELLTALAEIISPAKKVELGAIDDVWALYDSVDPYNTSARKSIQSAQADYKKIISIWEEMNKEASRLLPSAEALGVKEAITRLKRAKKESATMKKSFEKDLNVLNRYA